MIKFCDACKEFSGIRVKFVKLKVPLEVLLMSPKGTPYEETITHRCEECGWGQTEKEMKESA